MDQPPPLRVYSCYIDDVLHTQPFPHGDLKGNELDVEANRQFQVWLEMTAPGAYNAGRVTGIRFADQIKEPDLE